MLAVPAERERLGSAEALAQTEGLSHGYVPKLFRPALLAPWIMEAVIER